MVGIVAADAKREFRFYQAAPLAGPLLDERAADSVEH